MAALASICGGAGFSASSFRQLFHSPSAEMTTAMTPMVSPKLIQRRRRTFASVDWESVMAQP
jgi:hypothetical protein